MRLEVVGFSSRIQQPSSTSFITRGILSEGSRTLESETTETSNQREPRINDEQSQTVAWSPGGQSSSFEHDAGSGGEHEGNDSSEFREATHPLSENNYLSDLGLDLETCTRVVRQCFHSFVDTFDVINHLPATNTTSLDAFDYSSLLESLSPIILYTLTAISIQANCRDFNNELPCHWELAVESLRTEALRMVPAITWNSRNFTLDQVVALNLSSQFWCWQKSLVMVAARWNVLSQLMWNEVQVDIVPYRDLQSKYHFPSVSHHAIKIEHFTF